MASLDHQDAAKIVDCVTVAKSLSIPDWTSMAAEDFGLLEFAALRYTAKQRIKYTLRIGCGEEKYGMSASYLDQSMEQAA